MHRVIDDEEVELCGIVTRSRAMKAVLGAIWRLAGLDEVVLIEGETGTGKSLVARALHALSPRAGLPFTTIECGSLPESLIDSELWGYERGAFTGANRAYPGRVEAARGGTLFLDEINSMSTATQIKLLRFLAEGEFYRVGCAHPVRIDVRVIAATNEPLERLVASGRMRADFFYRVNVLKIALPPLRERLEDQSLLVQHFLASDPLARRCGSASSNETLLRKLQGHAWPGNVRELFNRLRREIVFADDGSGPPSLDTEEPLHEAPPALVTRSPEPPPPVAGRHLTFRDWMLDREREYLIDLVNRVKGTARQAAASGLPARTLYRKLRRLSLNRGSAA